MIFVFNSVQNIVGKGETALFSKDYFHGVVKNQDCMVKTQPLTHYQMTNFRLFQTERVCRQQFQI